MKYSMILGVLFLSCTHIYADKSFGTKEYKEVTILEKGVKRKQKVLISENIEAVQGTKVARRDAAVSGEQGIVVMFKQHKRKDIEAFAEKYGLKLRKKLLSGYYLFDNLSDDTDEEVVANIIESEKDVQTVKLNRKKHNRMR